MLPNVSPTALTAGLVGIGLSVVTLAGARALKLDTRTLTTMLAMLVATYYVLFAVLGGSGRAVIVESAIALVFIAFAALGSRYSMALVVAVLGAHGALDAVHGSLVTDPGVPGWWPYFCGAFDVAAALILVAAGVARRQQQVSPYVQVGSQFVQE